MKRVMIVAAALTMACAVPAFAGQNDVKKDRREVKQGAGG